MDELFEALAVPVVQCDPDAGIVWASSELRDRFGGTLPALEQWQVGPVDLGRSADELVRSGHPEFEAWLPQLPAAGFLVRNRPNPQGFLLTLVPLDIHKRGSTDLPVDRPPDLFMRLDTEGIVRFCSAPCMGKPPSDVMGKCFFDVLPPEFGEPMRLRVAEVVASKQTATQQGRAVSGGAMRSTVQRLSPIVSDGVVVEVALQHWDTTDDVNAAEVLEVTERQYRQVIENSLDLIGILETNSGLITFVSPNCVDILGYEQAAVVGRSVFDFIEDRDLEVARQRIDNLFTGRSNEAKLEILMRHADGSRRLFETRGRLLAKERGERQIIVNARDITEIRETQVLRRSLMRADKLAAIGQVAASVAHEVNNPASFIMTNLHVMQEDLEQIATVFERARSILGEVAPHRLDELQAQRDDEISIDEALVEVGAMLTTNLRGMERISHIVRELRGFSRDEEDVREIVDLVQTARGACSMVRTQLSYFADLREDYPDVLPPVYGDRGKIAQVLINLLVNASQSLRQSDRDSGRELSVTLSIYEEAGSVRVDVTDTGGGVDEQVRAQIFDPFVTTKGEEEGTGLGLWLCREIVEQFHGELWLDQTGEDGSRFSFRLPALVTFDLPQSPFEELSSSAEVVIPSSRILLIDDDQLVLDAYTKMLEPHHSVTIALGGEAALAILESGDEFDLVICDVTMPNYDGPTIKRAIEEIRPELGERLYFGSTGVFTEQTRRFVEEEVDGRVFRKPISARQLRGLVASAVLE